LDEIDKPHFESGELTLTQFIFTNGYKIKWLIKFF